MKSYIRIFALLFVLAGFANAYAKEEAPANPVVTNASLVRLDNMMNTAFTLDLSGVKVKSTEAALFTPMIVNGTDTLALPGVAVYGRTRWIQCQRNNWKPLREDGEIALRASKDIEPLNYANSVPYQSWMNGSELIIRRTDYGCAGCNKGSSSADVALYKEVKYQPVFIYEEAVAETIKTRELSGRAFIDFIVNKTDINPNYRRNSVELAKIIGTIDSVKNDKDITVTSLEIKGTASPEGPYQNNVRLAKGRTEALTEYVRKLYSFPKDFIKTSYEPVDWEGLRDWLKNNNIEHRDEILAIVDGGLEPEARNSKIMNTYPVQYKWLLDNVYPALRHSDYRIEYTIRQFSDVAEIAEVMRTAPQKLSLNEMYLLAGSLEKGSDAYNEVFETAVRMYPNDQVANLNAANSAMSRNDFNNAARYLEKAGNGAQAVYARGVLQALQGNYADAIRLVEQAKALGLQNTDEILQNLKDAQKYAN